MPKPSSPPSGMVDADNSGTFGGAGDYAIVLDHLNSTILFGPADVI
jgi:hypothetical protein